MADNINENGSESSQEGHEKEASHSYDTENPSQRDTPRETENEQEINADDKLKARQLAAHMQITDREFIEKSEKQFAQARVKQLEQSALLQAQLLRGGESRELTPLDIYLNNIDPVNEKIPDSQARSSYAYVKESLIPEIMKGKNISEVDRNALNKYLSTTPPARTKETMYDELSKVINKYNLKEKIYDPNNSAVQELNRYRPKDLEAVLKIFIAYAGEEYAPGGKYELIEKGGRVRLDHLFFYFRSQLCIQSGLDPDNPQANFLQGINAPSGISQVSVLDFATNKMYLKVTNENGIQYVPKENEILADKILTEIFVAQSQHGFDAGYRVGGDKNEETLVKYMDSVTGRNISSRNIFEDYDEQGIEVTFNEGTDRERTNIHQVGEAQRFADRLYARMNFLEYHDDKSMDMLDENNLFIQHLKKVYVREVYKKGKGSKYSEEIIDSWDSPESQDKPPVNVESIFFKDIALAHLKTMYSKKDSALQNMMGLSDAFFNRRKLGELEVDGLYDILFTENVEERRKKINLYEKDLAYEYISKFNKEHEKEGIAITQDQLKEWFVKRNDPRWTEQIKNLPHKKSILTFSKSFQGLMASFYTIDGRREITATINDQISALEKRERSPLENSTDKQALQKTIKVEKEYGKVINELISLGDYRNLALLLTFRSANEKTGLNKNGEINLRDKYKEKGQQILNFWRIQKPEKEIVALVRNAIKHSIGVAYDLDIREAEYAELRAQKRTRIFGSAALNDTTATGFNPLTKFMWTGAYLFNQVGKNWRGNLYRTFEFKRLGVSMWEWLHGSYKDKNGQIQDMSLLESIESRRLVKIKMADGLERSYTDQHLNSVLGMLKRFTTAKEDTLDIVLKAATINSVTGDSTPNMDALQTILDVWNKSDRYGFDAAALSWTRPGSSIGVEFKLGIDKNGVSKPTMNFVPKIDPNTKKPIRQSLLENMFGQSFQKMSGYKRKEFSEKLDKEVARQGLFTEIHTAVLDAKNSKVPGKYKIFTDNMDRVIRRLFKNIPLSYESVETPFVPGQNAGLKTNKYIEAAASPIRLAAHSWSSMLATWDKVVLGRKTNTPYIHVVSSFANDEEIDSMLGVAAWYRKYMRPAKDTLGFFSLIFMALFKSFREQAVKTKWS